MDEYISREKVLKKLQMQLLDLESNQDKGEYSELCENRGARDALDEAIDDIRTIKAADVQPVNQWISVKDRLPEIGKSVLINYPKWDGDEIQVAKLEDNGMMFDICGEFNIGTGVITHWMPLPEPPKDGDAE